MEDVNPNNSANELVSVVTVFDSKQYIENIKSSITEGRVNPLAAYTVLKRMAKVSEEIFKDKEIKKLALDEAEKHLAGNAKSFNLYSAQICKAATYTYYDFSGCQHEVLDKLYRIQEDVKASIKQIEEELKLMIVPEGKTMFGIENNNKIINFTTMPELVWEGYGVDGTVQPPKKIQDLGLKFMKI